MEEKRERNRNRSTITDLPPEMREILHERLADIRYSYRDIAAEITEHGHPISKSAVGRYAQTLNKDLQRVKAARERIDAIISTAVEHKNLQATEAATAMYLDKLIERLASIDEEDFEGIPLDKLGRVLAHFVRNETYKQRILNEDTEKIEAATSKIMGKLQSALPDNPELLAELKQFVGFVTHGEEAPNE